MNSPEYKVFFFGKSLPGDTMEVTRLFVVNVSLDEESATPAPKRGACIGQAPMLSSPLLACRQEQLGRNV